MTMTDEATVLERPVPPHAPGGRAPVKTRVRAGLRTRANWLELLRFGVVGASGYAVNLATFAACVHGFGLGYIVAATIAFAVAVTNNFAWNRYWTFREADPDHLAHHQAARFLSVSAAGFLVNLGVLTLLISSAAFAELPAQAVAIASVTPLTFLGNKLWTFRS